MSRWSDAAFEQERLLGTIKHNPIFREYLTDFQEHAYEELFPPGLMLRLHEQLLQEADPMYVSMQVTELWDYARTSFKPEPLQPWDLPLNTCFALLPQPMLMRDADGDLISFRALSWIIVNTRDRPMDQWDQDNHPEGLWYTLWSHIDDGNDSFYRNDKGVPEREAWEALGVWSVLFSGFLPFGMLEDYEVKAFQDSSVGDDPSIDDLGNAVKVRRDTWLLLQSFWRLSRQIVPVKEKLPRQLRRERFRHFRTEDVTVIRLRRQSQPNDNEPEYTIGEDFHYLNRGGWKNQYFPSQGPCHLEDGSVNPESHRQIYVLPFLKGNLDAPMKNPQRAFEFTR